MPGKLATPAAASVKAGKAVVAALRAHGLLLVQDKLLPNVVTLVTGDRPKGSWWSHPQGRQVFAALAVLEDHPDVLFIKLLDGKVTLVHRRLWSSLLTVIAAEAPWQNTGLSPAARRLLGRVKAADAPAPCSGKAIKELEQRLLVHTAQRHTDQGKHVLVAQSWESWARGARVRPGRSAPRAMHRLEQAAAGIGAAAGALPWV